MFQNYLLPLAAFLTITLAGATALACSPPPEGWQLMGNSVQGAEEGPFVLAFQRYDGVDPAQQLDLSVTVSNAAGDAVQGELVEIDGSGETRRYSWTPDAPLPSVDAPYSLGLDVVDSDFGLMEIPLELNSGLTDPTVSLNGLVAEEYREARTESCCEQESDQCFVPCGDDDLGTCEICWPTSYDYPVLTQADVSIDGKFASHRYDLVVLTGPDLESLTEHYVESVARPLESWTPVTGRFSDGEEFDHCTAVELRDAVTDETNRIGEGCISEAEIQEIERTEPEAPDLSACSGSTRFDIDENGVRTEAPLEKSDSGCSATGKTETGGLAVILLALFGLRRSRR